MAYPNGYQGKSFILLKYIEEESEVPFYTDTQSDAFKILFFVFRISCTLKTKATTETAESDGKDTYKLKNLPSCGTQMKVN